MSIEKFQRAELPTKYKNYDPSTSKHDEWNQKYSRLKTAVESKGIAIIIGTRGTGKTQMAVSAAGYGCLEHDMSVCYTTAIDLFYDMRDASNNGTLRETKRIYTSTEILIIDALEVRADTAFESRSLNDIIDSRYSENKCTILVSNDSQKTFVEYLGSSVFDRASENGIAIQCNWESFRR